MKDAVGHLTHQWGANGEIIASHTNASGIKISKRNYKRNRKLDYSILCWSMLVHQPLTYGGQEW